MTISDEDLIECWFCRLAAPEIVTKLGLQSTSELRLLWRRLKELGMIKVHREPRNDLFKKAKYVSRPRPLTQTRAGFSL